MTTHPRFRAATLALLTLAAACGAEAGGDAGFVCKADADCAALDDGDACNGQLRCDLASGVCAVAKASVVVCDAGGDSACAHNRCDPATGACAMAAAPAGAACDDGVACTLGDRCVDGACAAGKNACDCAGDSDCADDGDLCNGVPFCNIGVFPHRCELVQSSVVTCPSSDDPCKAYACDKDNGKCKLMALPDGDACDDGDPCTAADACNLGGCKGGADLCACKSDADCPDLDDDPCTGVSYCDKAGGSGKCKTNPATVVACGTAADTACLKNTCSKAAGGCKLQPVAEKVACDDGDPCTAGTVCVGGSCAAGTDVCACKSNADCDGADDGDLCNGLPFCNLQSGKCQTNPATVVSCPTVDDTACSKHVCLPKTGTCVALPRAEVSQIGCQSVVVGGGIVVQFCAYAAKQPGAAGDPGPFICEDGNACTKGDVCDGSACKPGAVVCACANDADCAGQDDGDVCNGTLFCNPQSGKCELNPKTVVSCASVDDTACVKNTCQAKTGQCLPQPVPPNTACDDGNPCTQTDLCKLGVCTAGTFVCECQKDSDCAGKDDGDLCNGLQFCDLSGAKPACKPQPGSEVFCPKGANTACLHNTCAAKTGACSLQPVKAGTACDDDEPCTAATACDGKGGCAGGGGASCDDGDPCTVDSCVKGQGCAHVAKSCDDGNACTKTACDAKLGTCGSVAVGKGVACNADGDGCTVGDACDGKGACLAGSPAVCNAQTGACQVNACQSKGADGFACAVVAAKDGTLCKDGDPCLTGSACAGGVCKAGTVSTLFALAPKPSGAMAFEAACFATGALKDGIGGGSGGVVVAGALTTGPDKGRWLVTALGRDGKQAFELKVQPPAGISELLAVRAVLDRGPLGVLVVGRAQRSDKSLTAVSIHIGTNGVALPAVHHGAGEPGSVRYDAAALHTTGNLVLAGVRQTADLTGVVTMRAPTGAAIWTEEVSPQWVDASKLLVLANGTIAVAATNHPHSGGFGAIGYFFRGLGADGSTLWTLAQGAPGQLVQVATLAKTGDGNLRTFVRILGLDGVLAAGHWFSVDPKTGGVVNLDRPIEGLDEVPLVSSSAGDHIVWAAASESKGLPIALADRFGNMLWRRVVAAGIDQASAVLASPDLERIFAIGSAGTGANRQPRAVMLDRWGYASCGERGACAGKPWSGCDDGTACTNDGCDATFGCTHTPKTANLCDPGIACTHEGKCGTGKCVAHAYGRTYVTGYFSKLSHAAGLTLTATGVPTHWVVAEPGDPQATFVAAGQVGLADGQLSDHAGAPTPGLLTPARVARSPAGQHFVAGGVADGQRKSLRTWLFSSDYEKPGADATVHDTVCKTCSIHVSAAVAAANGAFYAGATGERHGGTAIVLRRNPDGATAWVRMLGSDTKASSVTALAARADGGVAWSGQTVVAGKVYPVINWVSSGNGGLGELVDSSSPNGGFNAICERSDGGLLAAGSIPVDAVTTGLVLAASAAGKLLWRKVAPLADGMIFNNALALGAGQFVLAGALQAGGQTGLVLTRRSASGAPLWDRQHRYDNQHDIAPMPGTLLQLGDGGFAMTAQVAVPIAGQLVVRSDPSGHISCNDAGGCATKAVDSCDDVNVCTTDWCDPKAGCQHAALDGVECGGGGTCVAGVCKKP